MAKKADLMGLGLPFSLADKMATEPSAVTASGSSQASAAQIDDSQFLVYVIATNSGNYLNLPPIGGFNGCLLGDDFIVNNQLSASIVITAATGTTISVGGSNTTGTTGVSVASHTTSTFYPLTSTSWLGLKGS